MQYLVTSWCLFDDLTQTLLDQFSFAPKARFRPAGLAERDEESTELCHHTEVRLTGIINPSVVCTHSLVVQRPHTLGAECPSAHLAGDFWHSWQETDLSGRMYEEGNRDGQEEWRMQASWT